MVEKDVGVKFKIYRDDTKVPEEKPATAESLLEISLIILESEVKCSAPWCEHCQKITPVWDELAKSLERSEQLNIVKIDGMQNHALMYRESSEELRKGVEMNRRVS